MKNKFQKYVGIRNYLISNTVFLKLYYSLVKKNSRRELYLTQRCERSEVGLCLLDPGPVVEEGFCHQVPHPDS